MVMNARVIYQPHQLPAMKEALLTKSQLERSTLQREYAKFGQEIMGRTNFPLVFFCTTHLSLSLQARSQLRCMLKQNKEPCNAARKCHEEVHIDPAVAKNSYSDSRVKHSLGSIAVT